MSQWGDIYPGVRMGVRTLTGSLFLVASILALPGYGQSEKNRLIVRFKDGVTVFGTDTIRENLGMKLRKRLSQLGPVEIVEIPKNISSKNAKKLYSQNPNILYVEEDFQIRVNPIESDAAKPKNPYVQQWALNNAGQKVGSLVGKKDADMNGPETWELTKGDKEVVLGLIDTGIFYTHPDLVPNVWENPGEIAGNGKDDDGNKIIDDIYGINAVNHTGDPLDDNGHGTHVSGIMGGSGSDGKGVFGINQKVSIATCKFLDSEGGGRMSDALVCMDYFANLKTRVRNPVNLVAINASWGGGGSSQAMQDAIKVLGDVGILFVAAAGNDGEDNDQVESFPANYLLSNIISVAATNNQDELADFSNFGRRSVHVAAPGMDIMSTYLNNEYKVFSGTSMATPYVTGLIGLLKAKDPSLSAKQLRNLVISGGTSLDVLSAKTLSGRRIRGVDQDGTGSLTCRNQTTNTRMAPKDANVSVKVGEAVEFSVLKIKCGEAEGAPIMAVNMGSAVGFADVDNSGLYSAKWTAAAAGSYDFDLGDGEKVTVTVTK